MAVTVALVTVGCGSDDNSTEATGKTESSTTRAADIADYCDRAAAYLDATTSIDSSSPTSMIEGFGAAAVAARATADVAPEEVRETHERLASAAEALVAGLQARAPRTLEELEAVNEELTAELTAEYGDLEQETRQAQEFGSEQCGLSSE
jgi:hypothetical protein